MKSLMGITFRIPLFCKSRKKTYNRHSLIPHFSQLLRYFQGFVSKATIIGSGLCFLEQDNSTYRRCPLSYMSLLADYNWQLLLEMNSADVRNSPYSTSNFLSCQYDYVVFRSHTEKWRSNFLQCSSALAHDKLIFCNA